MLPEEGAKTVLLLVSLQVNVDIENTAPWHVDLRVHALLQSASEEVKIVFCGPLEIVALVFNSQAKRHPAEKIARKC